MKIIRSKMFETNSSSCHSIIICEDKRMDGTVDGILKPSMEQLNFEHGTKVLSTFLEKFYYILVEKYGNGWDWDVPNKKVATIFDFTDDPEILEIISKYIPDFQYLEFPTADETHPEYYRLAIDKSSGVYHGYIDSQSHGLAEEFIDEYTTLEEFLINDKYKIIVDGDSLDFTDAYFDKNKDKIKAYYREYSGYVKLVK